MHRFANYVAGRGEAEFQRGCGADRSLRVVRRERDAIRLGQRCDPSGLGQSAAVRDVGLGDAARPPLEELAKRVNAISRSPVAIGVRTAR